MCAKLLLRRGTSPIYIPYFDDNNPYQPDEDESLPTTTPTYVPDTESDVASTVQTHDEDDIAFGKPQPLQYVLENSRRGASVSLESDNNPQGWDLKTLACRYVQYVHKVCLAVSIDYIDDFRQDFLERDPRAPDNALLRKTVKIYNKGPSTQSLRYNVDVVSDVLRVKGCVLEIFSSTAQDKTERDIRQLNEKTEEVLSALKDAEQGENIGEDQLGDIFKAGRVLCRMMDRGDMVEEVKRLKKDWGIFKWFGDIGTSELE